MKEMADYSAIMHHFDKNNLHYFTFHPKLGKDIKAIISDLPSNASVKDISNELVVMRFSVINVCQQQTAHCTMKATKLLHFSYSLSHSNKVRNPRKF
jgi:hypothetical protein